MKKDEVLRYLVDVWNKVRMDRDNVFEDEYRNRYWEAMQIVKKLIIDYGSDSEG